MIHQSKFRIPFILFSLCFSCGIYGNDFPFRVGETLNYTAKFNFIPAGTAALKIVSLDTVNNIPSFHIQYSARTGSFADRLFKIRDRVDSWIDIEGLFVHRQVKSIRQGNYRKNSQTELFYGDSLAVVNNDSIHISEIVFDPYSLFYYLRTIPLVLKETLKMVTFDNNSFTNFQLHVDKVESITVPAGIFKCLVIKPFKDGKTLLRNEGDMTIWFSEDLRRIPVQILVKLKYGTMNLKLTSFSL
jgi:hypothetical protein